MGISIGEIVLHRIDREAARLFDLRDVAAAGEDAEAVHQMRVSVRRIRALLRAFAPILPEPLLSLDPPLQWIGGSLGAVRDLDVLRERFPSCLIKIDAARSVRLSQLREDLSSDRFESLVGTLRSAGDHRRYDTALAGAPFELVAPDILRRQYLKVKELGSVTEPAQIHRLRKRAKRLRYVSDCFTDSYGKAADRFSGALRALQDLLGQYQDDVVAEQLLAEIGCDETLEAGKLHGLEEALSDLHKQWRKLKRAMKRKRSDVWKARSDDLG